MATNKSDPAALEYAKALLQLGTEKNCLGHIFEDLEALNSAYRNDKVFRGFFTSPKVSQAFKVQVVKSALGGKIHEMTQNFLALLIRKRRETLLDNIVDALAKYRDESENRVHVWVEAARDLDSDQQASLTSQMAASTGKSVSLHIIVRPELLGGMRIRVGDKLLDSSLRRRLTDLSSRLMSRDSAFARSADAAEVDSLFERSKNAASA